MEKYLYLTKVKWADTWINGGEIPIYLASTYLHNQREGTLTPDENLVHESPVNLKSFSPTMHIEDGKNLNFKNCSFGGQIIPDIVNANYYTEDGLILSFCNRFSKDIAKGLGKKACVKITNLEKLKSEIDKQLGVEGVNKECEYTYDHQRNHFLKSKEDSWQEEYRIFWKYPKGTVVKILVGIAEFVAEFE
jgi:hypothetical protein